MGRLRKFQLRNLFKQKSFYVCMFVIIGLSVLMTISNALITNLTAIKASKSNSNDTLLAFINPGHFDTILTVFVALFFSLDVSNGTMKNIIARGFSRKQVFITKYTTTIIGVSIMFILSFIISYLISIIVGNTLVSIDSDTLSKIFVYYVALIGLTSLYSFISTIPSKSSGALVACLLTSFLVPGILVMIDALLKLKKCFTISQFWIANAYNNETFEAFIISFIYTALSIILGIIIYSRKEIK